MSAEFAGFGSVEERLTRLEMLSALQGQEAHKVQVSLDSLKDGSVQLGSPVGFLITSAGSARTSNHAVNARFDGTAWRPLVVGQPAALMTLDSGGVLSVLTQAVATNPIVWTTQAPNLVNVPHVIVSHSVAQAIPNNTVTALAFNTETRDGYGYHNPGANTLLTVPAGLAGVHLVGGFAIHQSVAGGTRRLFQLRQNGAGGPQGESGSAPAAASFPAFSPLSLFLAAAGDTFDMIALQDCGAPNNVLAGCGLWAYRVGP